MEKTKNLAAHLKLALVGKFSHGYPNMNTIRTYFSKLDLRGAHSIGVINVKHILIKLNNEEDLSRLWLKQIMFIDSFPMQLSKWSLKFNPRVESPIAPGDRASSVNIPPNRTAAPNDLQASNSSSGTAENNLKSTAIHGQSDNDENSHSDTMPGLETIPEEDRQQQDGVGGQVNDEEEDAMLEERGLASNREIHLVSGSADVNSGSPFTWIDHRLWQCLDRLLFSTEWIDLWPKTSVKHLPRHMSDHCPWLVSVQSSVRTFPFLFQFQNMWCRHPNFMRTAEECWAIPVQQTGMLKLKEKLFRLKHCFRH
ncbi:hypothetical protein Sango_1604400 [Sesamum angolense]|uniref:DUF4283 domain-containing protein n=1 Tax=Sesamum angolense TaxID=2727404 RepID=A0AAE1WJN8_9LAMI|nr:hypothetical protein Sango_1604400 [Sesamum angolense]